jgi:hypothetical protein
MGRIAGAMQTIIFWKCLPKIEGSDRGQKIWGKSRAFSADVQPAGGRVQAFFLGLSLWADFSDFLHLGKILLMLKNPYYWTKLILPFPYPRIRFA